MLKESIQTKDLAVTAMLAAVLAILGTLKLPSIIPGAEFQLSAPFALSMAACFGFRRYFTIGILASAINLLLGTHTLLNVTIAMVFRLAAGGLISLLGPKPIPLIISGPVGTAAGRVVLSLIMHTSPLVLIGGAVPGMIFTAILTPVMYPAMKKVLSMAGAGEGSRQS